MSLKASLEQFRTERRALEEKIKEAANVVFTNEVQDLFTKYPDLNSFSWKQYTPYFNDGSMCTFNAHTDDVSVEFLGVPTNEDKDDSTYSRFSIEHKRKTGKNWNDTPFVDHPVNDAALDIIAFLRQFEGDDLLGFFGDHVQVTVHRDGRVEQDEYNHE